jgi:hypothetical protein
MAVQVWVSPAATRWKTHTEGRSNQDRTYSTQKAAIREGKERAKELKCELIIQGKNGRIREKDSFGNDPRNIPG